MRTAPPLAALLLVLLVASCGLLTPAIADDQWGTWTLGPGSFGDLRWRSPVANEAALPATGNVLGDARVALDEASLWLWDGADWTAIGGSAGTVESVGLTVPSFLSVSGSPVTSSGTLAVTLASAPVSHVLIGPTAGFPAAPTFRALGVSDIPALGYASQSHATTHEDGGSDETAVEDLPTACTVGQGFESDGAGGVVCADADAGGGAVSIADLTSGTNTTMAGVIGAGASLKKASTGTIDASGIDADGDGNRNVYESSSVLYFDPADSGTTDNRWDAFGVKLYSSATGFTIYSGTSPVASLERGFTTGDPTLSLNANGRIAWNSATGSAISPAYDVRLVRAAAGKLAVQGATAGGAVFRIEPLASAPGTCTIGDFYVDTSGAACACSATNTWENMHATGTCV